MRKLKSTNYIIMSKRFLSLIDLNNDLGVKLFEVTILSNK